MSSASGESARASSSFLSLSSLKRGKSVPSEKPAMQIRGVFREGKSANSAFKPG